MIDVSTVVGLFGELIENLPFSLLTLAGSFAGRSVVDSFWAEVVLDVPSFSATAFSSTASVVLGVAGLVDVLLVPVGFFSFFCFFFRPRIGATSTSGSNGLVSAIWAAASQGGNRFLTEAES